MSVTLKSADEIEKMRAAGALASQVLDMIGPHVTPGVTTGELDRICHEYIVAHRAVPAPLNYRGFPKSICTSINHQVCHGIPGSKVLKDGDIVNIDVTVILDGWHGDTSRMYTVGKPTVKGQRICDIAKHALDIGLQVAGPGVTLGDIGHAIQTYAEGEGCSVVREYCGHGIGKLFHEKPEVLHYGRPNTGLRLTPGMTFTIEPMVNLGKPQTKTLPDGWTVVTKDRSLSAQWEHTIAITDNGIDILTLS